MSKQMTVAIAGLGSRGRDTYAKAAKIYPDKMKIVAIADIDPEKVKLTAEEYDVPMSHCYESAEDMLKEEKLADVMIIATQDRQHVGQAIKALKKGYHLLLEKPIQEIQGKTGVVISARTDAQKCFAEANSQYNLAAYTNHADEAYPLPVCTKAAELYDLEATELQKAYNGEESLSDVCKSLTKQADKLLQE